LSLIVPCAAKFDLKIPKRAILHSSARKAPGTGVDISFSEHEAFALINGLRIMNHRWTQSFAVSIMRRVRPDLVREHARILRQDPEKLFDWETIRASAREGDIAVDNTDPVFLTLASTAERAADEGKTVPLAAVCHRWEQVSRFSRAVSASSLTYFEFATLAHTLHQELLKTKPRANPRTSFQRSEFFGRRALEALGVVWPAATAQRGRRSSLR
jgi:hypothetical protein